MTFIPNTPDPEHQKHFERSFIEQIQSDMIKKLREDAEKIFYSAQKNSTLDRIWRGIYGKRFVSQITKDLLK